MRARSLSFTAGRGAWGVAKRAVAVLAGGVCLFALTACTSDAPESSAPETCDPTLDLASTAFGPYTALNQIPTIPPGGEEGPHGFWSGYPLFLATVEDNSFDPCADLSWVTLSGSTQDDLDHADSAAVLLFHRDQLLTDPLPIQVAANPLVERISGNKIQVTFGHYASPGQTVSREQQSATFSWEEGGLNVAEFDLLREYSKTATTLDLRAAPPASDVPALPRGNVYHQPFDAEYELAEYPGSNVRIQLDEDSELLCILNFAERHNNWGWIGCAGYGVDWPFVEPAFEAPPATDPLTPSPGTTANYLQIALLPTTLATTYFDEETISDFPVAHTIAAGTLTRVGHYLIDTRDAHPRLIYGGAAIEIREDGFESAPANILDRSRWQP
ncbi:LppP/LprE family lipoprotein [Corynebacterium sp. A21]|uniref:LppP/LprE family lipoprotein n=1 Tax=Corynebacterium sp. A21 TaxID=3457318 RepID=UPI003FCFC686